MIILHSPHAYQWLEPRNNVFTKAKETRRISVKILVDNCHRQVWETLYGVLFKEYNDLLHHMIVWCQAGQSEEVLVQL